MPPLLRRNPSRHPALPVVGLRQLERSLAQLDQDLQLLDQLLPPRRPDFCPPAPSALALPTASSIGQGSVQSISLHQSPW
jgi:hypothetical protein